MLIDVVNSGWAPVYTLNLNEDVPGYFISGHLGRLATRGDVNLHQQYLADVDASARKALGEVDPTPYLQNYGDNPWAGLKTYLHAVTDRAAAPVIDKYADKLAAADVYTDDHALGPGVHPPRPGLCVPDPSLNVVVQPGRVALTLRSTHSSPL
jgi:hypothetical protein